MNVSISHVGFSDESNWNIGRSRSLGLVTVPVAYLDQIERKLWQILEGSGVSEFKWKKLGGAKGRFAAMKMCKLAIDEVNSGHMRIDVLIWDIQDSRHNVQGRDDIENLQRMYYHLFRNVLRTRWPDEAIWRLIPDEHTAIEWETIKDYLDDASERIIVEHSLMTKGTFRFRLLQEFSLEEVVPGKSSEQPLIQLADLFAGLAVFSREKFNEYQTWQRNYTSQAAIFDDTSDRVGSSYSSKERFKVLRFLNDECKKRKLGVSLESKKGLWTPDPRRPINFWLYVPQHSDDKAPVKRRR